MKSATRFHGKGNFLMEVEDAQTSELFSIPLDFAGTF